MLSAVFAALALVDSVSKVAPRMRFGVKMVPVNAAPAYGLLDHVNAFGGSEMNLEPAGFLGRKSELENDRYGCELCGGGGCLMCGQGSNPAAFKVLRDALGGSEINLEPAGFLGRKLELENDRYGCELCGGGGCLVCGQ